MKNYSNLKSSSKKITDAEFCGSVGTKSANGTLTFRYKGEFRQVDGEFYAEEAKNGKDVILHQFFPDNDNEFTLRMKGAID